MILELEEQLYARAKIILQDIQQLLETVIDPYTIKLDAVDTVDAHIYTFLTKFDKLLEAVGHLEHVDQRTQNFMRNLKSGEARMDLQDLDEDNVQLQKQTQYAKNALDLVAVHIENLQESLRGTRNAQHIKNLLGLISKEFTKAFEAITKVIKISKQEAQMSKQAQKDLQESLELLKKQHEHYSDNLMDNIIHMEESLKDYS